MASDEDPGAMLGLTPQLLNTPGTTTPSITWEDVAAELNSLRSRADALEAHAKWIADEYEKSVAVNQRLSDRVEVLDKTVSDQAAVIEHLGNTRPSPTNEIKGADPAVFEGNPRELDAWILACRLRFSLQPSKFASEEVKVQFAITFLKGPPKAWVNPLASKFLVDRTGVPEFESFETFVTSIRSLYGDPNLERNSTNQLKIIKQTTSVPEYYSRFIGFSQHTRHNDVGLRDFFYDGLKETLKDELATKECPTLESLKVMATYLDSRMQERKWEREHQTRKNPDNPPNNNGTRLTYTRPPPVQQAPPIPPRPQSHPTPTTRPYQALGPPRPAIRPAPAPAPLSDGTTPMELDNQRMLRPLSQEERDQCLREG
jgi:hypothetical protein